MHRFAISSGRAESRPVSVSGDPDRESGIPDRSRAPSHLRTGRRCEGHLRIGSVRSCGCVHRGRGQRVPARAASFAGRHFSRSRHGPRAMRLAGAGRQGARNITELESRVARAQYPCFRGVFACPETRNDGARNGKNGEESAAVRKHTLGVRQPVAAKTTDVPKERAERQFAVWRMPRASYETNKRKAKISADRVSDGPHQRGALGGRCFTAHGAISVFTYRPATMRCVIIVAI